MEKLIIVLKREYEDFLTTPFPQELAEKEINGIELALLDTEMSGIIQKFVLNEGRLTEQNVDELMQAYHDLLHIYAALLPAEQQYFAQLQQMAGAILRFKEQC